MDIQDFQGLTKYKFVLPTFYVFSWICMLLGPTLFETTYARICVFIFVYTDIKIVLFFINMIIINVKAHRIFQKHANKEEPIEIVDMGNQERIDTSQQIYYGFVLPNFKEEIQMIAQTLDRLAGHKRARGRYLVFLAMEAHEEGCEAKAEQLMSRYKDKFKMIEYTRHEVKQHEQKGKASNVSWCVEHMQPFLEKVMVDPDQVFLTIFDADSWAPDLYIEVLEQQIISHYEHRHTIMFQPPQIFTRNNLDVPIITRVHDLLHSYIHLTNLFSFFEFTFPISNYTVSYKMAKDIGFWDTCADAIGEDYHTTLKAYWKLNGQFRTIPIYVPFNQVNISTGNGYVEDVLARFWQAERHAQGCADFAYNLKMMFAHEFKAKHLLIFFNVFQTFTLTGFIPWIFISILLQAHVLYFGSSQPPEIINPLILTVLINIMSVVSTLTYFLFEYYKRKANTLIYHRENESLLRMLEYPIMFTVNFFMITVPTFVIAAFMVLTGKREYIVAMKKNTSKNQNAFNHIDNTRSNNVKKNKSESTYTRNEDHAQKIETKKQLQGQDEGNEETNNYESKGNKSGDGKMREIQMVEVHV